MGYWAITSGSRGPSTALSAQETNFAAAWLEASGQCQADQRPVLLVAYDTEACGGLLSVNSSRGLLGLALLLAPAPGPRSRWRVQTAVLPGAAPALAARSPVARALADNAMAPALPLFEALAAGLATQLALPLSVGTKLQLMLQLMLQPQAENRHFEPP